ncbi:hypothetical protein O181_017156 [Austropuccinia psidii MF-1]|uniref:Pre-rRNA-processing protein RIX1 n=1 Tax=Austropuccinia psidii MF-1 TaxID=1389203 RepID=A0A9Q3C730_9BASI|nr:hypothetical protein [Austropuccinia psidii MF-1]
MATRFSPFATPTLSIIKSAIKAAQDVSGCLPNPATLSSTLEHVLKAVLNDVARHKLGDLFMSFSSTLNNTSKKYNKFNCTEMWNVPMVSDPMDFSIAERALTNLAFATHPILCLRILNCLIKCLLIQPTTLAQCLMGLNLAQNLTGILHNIFTCKDDSAGELAHLACSSLNIINLMICPRVPPIYLTEAQFNCEEDVEILEDGSKDETGDAIPESISVETPRKGLELVASKSTAALTANSKSPSNMLLKKPINMTFPFATSETVTQKQDMLVLSYQALGTKYPEIQKRKSDNSEVQDLAQPPIKKQIDQCEVDSDEESDDEPILQLIFNESNIQSDA